MPELPEVETVRRTLERLVLGARVVSARLVRADVCCLERARPEPAGQGRQASTRRVTGTDLLRGGVIARVGRRGKLLHLETEDGRGLAVHLGMSGQVLVDPPGRGLTHVHARWTLRRGEHTLRMVFRDPRRFGGLWALEHAAEGLERLHAGLGPDALEIGGEHLHGALAATRRAVKAVLLDQGVLAGVGNIYADESLFAAGIRPGRPGREVTRAEAERLAACVREVLRQAVAARGSTLRDYRSADGLAGEAQLRHAVYGRGGQECPQCRGGLAEETLGGRTTVWCERCQR